MSLKNKLSRSIAMAVTAFAFAGFVSAQDTSTAKPDDTQKQERHRGKFGRQGERGHGMKDGKFGRGGFGMLRGVELTDAQKEQIRSIREANKQDEGVREELRTLREAKRAGTLTDAQKDRMKVLREQAFAKGKAVHEQILAILTPEQKQQLEARKAEMQKRREERRKMRQERKQTTDQPTDN